MNDYYPMKVFLLFVLTLAVFSIHLHDPHFDKDLEEANNVLNVLSKVGKRLQKTPTITEKNYKENLAKIEKLLSKLSNSFGPKASRKTVQRKIPNWMKNLPPKRNSKRPSSGSRFKKVINKKRKQ